MRGRIFFLWRDREHFWSDQWLFDHFIFLRVHIFWNNGFLYIRFCLLPLYPFIYQLNSQCCLNVHYLFVQLWIISIIVYMVFLFTNFVERRCQHLLSDIWLWATFLSEASRESSRLFTNKRPFDTTSFHWHSNRANQWIYKCPVCIQILPSAYEFSTKKDLPYYLVQVKMQISYLFSRVFIYQVNNDQSQFVWS